MDGELDLRIGVLHAERGAIAAEAAEGFDVFFCESARIDFDGVLGIRSEFEMPMDRDGEAINFGGRQKSGGSPTEVQLGNGASGIEERRGEREFLFQPADVFPG